MSIYFLFLSRDAPLPFTNTLLLYPSITLEAQHPYH